MSLFSSGLSAENYRLTGLKNSALGASRSVTSALNVEENLSHCRISLLRRNRRGERQVSNSDENVHRTQDTIT